MSAIVQLDPGPNSAIQSCVAALRRIASFQLDPGIDRRMLDLGERKNSLTPHEHDELLGLLAFSQQRSIEKLEAELALNRLRQFFPDTVGAP